MCLQGCQGDVVQPHLGIGEVTVVEQDEVATVVADQGRDGGALAVDVHFQTVGTHQGTIAQGVDADPHSVGAQHGEPFGGTLHHVEPSEIALGVDVEVSLHDVHARGLEPGVGEVGEVSSGGVVQLGEQVGELGVAEFVCDEVLVHPGKEVLLADEGHQLLEGRRTLGIGDAVEVLLHGVQVDHVGCDRMRGGQLILGVAPRLALVGERHPRVLPTVLGADDGAAVVGAPLGEGLVEPQVVPPLHGDEVAEPHVCQLVQDRHVAVEVGCRRHPGTEQVLVSVSDAPGVLHGTGIELGHERLVVLLEGVGVVELGLVDVEPALGDVTNAIGVQMLLERLTTQDVGPQLTLGGGDGAVVDVVLTGNQGGEVGGDRHGGGEAPPAHAVVRAILRFGGGGVRHDDPVTRRDDL